MRLLELVRRTPSHRRDARLDIVDRSLERCRAPRSCDLATCQPELPTHRLGLRASRRSAKDPARPDHLTHVACEPSGIERATSPHEAFDRPARIARGLMAATTSPARSKHSAAMPGSQARSYSLAAAW
jgi:hypothetical protein